MIVLITGTRTGIGRSLAKHLLQSGHTVLGCSRRPAKAMPEGYTHFDVDLTDTPSLKGMFQAIGAAHGSIDAFINNAGRSVMSPFMLTSEEAIEDIFDLNVLAAMRSCREAVKLLRSSKHEAPSILNMSSVATLFSLEGQLAYAASKAAIEQVTRTLSREVAPMNIRVNALGLPPVATALTRSVERSKIDALVERQAFKRLCDFGDIVGPVEFLTSKAARFVTGETLYLGGVR